MKKEALRLSKHKLFNGAEGLCRIASLSHGKPNTGNAIIQGDNLLVLQALQEKCEGKVRCVYLDPPYNNKEEYNHYNDDLDHDTWLEQVTTRLECIFPLLREDGSLWISIDDREVHYLKVAADRILGRHNFVTTVIWNQRTTRENRRVFSQNHEYLLVYAKNPTVFKETRNLLEISSEVRSRYKNPDNDPRGPWQSISANVQAGHATNGQFYEVISPTGRRHAPPKGRCWAFNQKRMKEEIRKNNVWFGSDGNGVPRVKSFLHDAALGLTPDTIWPASEVGTSNAAKKHLLKIFPHEEVFDTPKPEELIYRILRIATNPSDWVLDAYLGSGTTAAVAHKINRLYIGIEQGQHAVTHCAQRLRLVVNGEQEGISKLVDWHGGGGFDFYRFQT
jgi:adenine-specific DNA-methyltransferase